MALTPVGDTHDPASGNIQYWGRTLNPTTGVTPQARPFKVGNWLDNVLVKYGIPVPSGSMLPPGARVYLEVSATMGITNTCSSGIWMAAPKLSFEVEAPEGTALTSDVNVLGE